MLKRLQFNRKSKNRSSRMWKMRNLAICLSQPNSITPKIRRPTKVATSEKWVICSTKICLSGSEKGTAGIIFSSPLIRRKIIIAANKELARLWKSNRGSFQSKRDTALPWNKSPTSRENSVRPGAKKTRYTKVKQFILESIRALDRVRAKRSRRNVRPQYTQKRVCLTR